MSELQQSPFSAIRGTIARYYADRLARFGATPGGVDWNSSESQALRFAKLMTVVEATGPFSLLDYGCGYGALADTLRTFPLPVTYCGFDISPEMIASARQRHQADAWCSFTTEPSRLPLADYVVASGIFNVKLQHTDAAWRDYVTETIESLHALASRGFAFNMLSTCSDPEKRRADLHYVDPLEMFDRCQRRFSPRVALLHDYPLYEFTIVVRK
jgi:SAM-dependent methyltransferase